MTMTKKAKEVIGFMKTRNTMSVGSRKMLSTPAAESSKYDDIKAETRRTMIKLENPLLFVAHAVTGSLIWTLYEVPVEPRMDILFGWTRQYDDELVVFGTMKVAWISIGILLVFAIGTAMFLSQIAWGLMQAHNRELVWSCLTTFLSIVGGTTVYIFWYGKTFSVGGIAWLFSMIMALQFFRSFVWIEIIPLATHKLKSAVQRIRKCCDGRFLKDVIFWETSSLALCLMWMSATVEAFGESKLGIDTTAAESFRSWGLVLLMFVRYLGTQYLISKAISSSFYPPRQQQHMVGDLPTDGTLISEYYLDDTDSCDSSSASCQDPSLPQDGRSIHDEESIWTDTARSIVVCEGEDDGEHHYSFVNRHDVSRHGSITQKRCHNTVRGRHVLDLILGQIVHGIKQARQQMERNTQLHHTEGMSGTSRTASASSLLSRASVSLIHHGIVLLEGFVFGMTETVQSIHRVLQRTYQVLDIISRRIGIGTMWTDLLLDLVLWFMTFAITLFTAIISVFLLSWITQGSSSLESDTGLRTVFTIAGVVGYAIASIMMGTVSTAVSILPMLSIARAATSHAASRTTSNK